MLWQMSAGMLLVLTTALGVVIGAVVGAPFGGAATGIAVGGGLGLAIGVGLMVHRQEVRVREQREAGRPERKLGRRQGRPPPSR